MRRRAADTAGRAGPRGQAARHPRHRGQAPRRLRAAAVAALTLAVGVVAWQALPRDRPIPPREARPDTEPARLRARVLRTLPHDREAFTQGLVWHQGQLYESAGGYGTSTLRRVDPPSGEVLARVELPPALFAEGLARVGGRLVQLTWREGRALVWDLERLAPIGEHAYTGEGWGLCFDGARLVMSDGSSRLSLRDPESFAEVDRLAVTLDGRLQPRLNELECAEGSVWANVWGEERILRIDPESGEVTAVADASGLLAPQERAAADVLNGIAYDGDRGVFLLTGKLWPKLFEVVFVPAT